MIGEDDAMIANYGFEDGSGGYYITIDTDKCRSCEERGCLFRCPAKIFELEVDDWDNEVLIVKAGECNRLKSICAECKPLSGRSELLPCEKACDLRAIVHSW